MRYGNVQIIVASSFLAEKSVHGPTTIDMNFNPALFEVVKQFDDV
jgi:hypothetical protein